MKQFKIKSWQNDPKGRTIRLIMTLLIGGLSLSATPNIYNAIAINPNDKPMEEYWGTLGDKSIEEYAKTIANQQGNEKVKSIEIWFKEAIDRNTNIPNEYKDVVKQSFLGVIYTKGQDFNEETLARMYRRFSTVEITSQSEEITKPDFAEGITYRDKNRIWIMS